MAQLYFHRLHVYVSVQCLISTISVTVRQLFELGSLSSGFRGTRLIQRLLIFTVFRLRESSA